MVRLGWLLNSGKSSHHGEGGAAVGWLAPVEWRHCEGIHAYKIKATIGIECWETLIRLKLKEEKSISDGDTEW